MPPKTFQRLLDLEISDYLGVTKYDGSINISEEFPDFVLRELFHPEVGGTAVEAWEFKENAPFITSTEAVERANRRLIELAQQHSRWLSVQSEDHFILREARYMASMIASEMRAIEEALDRDIEGDWVICLNNTGRIEPTGTQTDQEVVVLGSQIGPGLPELIDTWADPYSNDRPSQNLSVARWRIQVQHCTNMAAAMKSFRYWRSRLQVPQRRVEPPANNRVQAIAYLNHIFGGPFTNLREACLRLKETDPKTAMAIMATKELLCGSDPAPTRISHTRASSGSRSTPQLPSYDMP